MKHDAITADCLGRVASRVERTFDDEQRAKIAAYLRHLATRPGAGFRSGRDDADQFRAAPYWGNPL